MPRRGESSLFLPYSNSGKETHTQGKAQSSYQYFPVGTDDRLRKEGPMKTRASYFNSSFQDERADETVQSFPPQNSGDGGQREETSDRYVRQAVNRLFL